MNFLPLDAFNNCFYCVFDKRSGLNKLAVKIIPCLQYGYCPQETLFFRNSHFIYFCCHFEQ
jgi:hypothetical protein